MTDAIPNPMEIGIQPEEVFFAVLNEFIKRNSGEYPLNLRKLNKALWYAQEQYPVAMQGFGREVNAGEPFLYELEECVKEAEKAGLLSVTPSRREATLTSDSKKLESIFKEFGGNAELEETAKYICDRL